MPNEVQQYAIGRGWRNEWFYDEGDGVPCLETFDTLEEATDALDEYFADIRDDIAAGLAPPCRREDFRIAYVAFHPQRKRRSITMTSKNRSTNRTTGGTTTGAAVTAPPPPPPPPRC